MALCSEKQPIVPYSPTRLHPQLCRYVLLLLEWSPFSNLKNPNLFSFTSDGCTAYFLNFSPLPQPFQFCYIPFLALASGRHAKSRQRCTDVYADQPWQWQLQHLLLKSLLREGRVILRRKTSLRSFSIALFATKAIILFHRNHSSTREV